MRTIVINNPEKLVFGPGSFNQFVDDLKILGKRRLYILTVPFLTEQIRQKMESLAGFGISFKLNDALNSEPGFSHFYRFLEETQTFKPDGIIGIGGGSVLDAAKLLAALTDNEQKLQEVVGIGLLKKRSMYLACLPTTSGTGSEVSPNAILLDESDGMKKGIISSCLVPDAAYIDPLLTMGMPAEITASQVIVPMVSPFGADWTIDREAVRRMCEMFVRAEVSVFALGTTGEGDSMSGEQRETLLSYIVQEVNGQSAIYAGLTGNSLEESIKDSKKYTDLGVDCLVAKLPAYYPMNDSQMLLYLEKLADSVSLPLFIYNIPATTHHSIPLTVVEKLSYHPNIFGLKDSERNLERLDESINLWGEREDFDFLIGWAPMSVYGLQKGANGIVPSTGNLCPELYVQMLNAVRGGDEPAALELQQKTDLISALYQKERTLSQSIPALKTLMKMKGYCLGEVLPPMITMSLQEEESYLADCRNELEKLFLV